MNLPLVAPKPFKQFTPEEFHKWVKSMYALRVRGKPKPPEPAPGISISRTKKGTLSVRRTTKQRPFPYVLNAEIIALSQAMNISQLELYNLLKSKEYIITETRMQAELIYAQQKDMPW